MRVLKLLNWRYNSSKGNYLKMSQKRKCQYFKAAVDKALGNLKRP